MLRIVSPPCPPLEELALIIKAHQNRNLEFSFAAVNIRMYSFIMIIFLKKTFYLLCKEMNYVPVICHLIFERKKS